MSIDAGIKYRGLSHEGEYYRRWLTIFAGVNTGGIADITTTATSCSRRRWPSRTSCSSI
jgi:hypothetical protein